MYMYLVRACLAFVLNRAWETVRGECVDRSTCSSTGSVQMVDTYYTPCSGCTTRHAQAAPHAMLRLQWKSGLPPGVLGYWDVCPSHHQSLHSTVLIVYMYMDRHTLPHTLAPTCCFQFLLLIPNTGSSCSHTVHAHSLTQHT